MLNFKAKISAGGHDSYEAGAASDWREGAHDDLVIGVTLPCWYAEYSAAAAPSLWSPFDD
ncbi:MAG TPA: hypothetical protein VF916_00300 [Ktedonobacterales bacterium]